MRKYLKRRTNVKLWLAAVAIAVSPLPAESAGDDAAAIPESANYYASSLAQAYADAAALLQLGAWCRDRFPQECGSAVATAAPGLDKALKIMRLVTIFGNSDTTANMEHTYSNAADVRRVIMQKRTSFRGHLREYDEDLFARYGAALKVCPEPNSERAEQALSVVSALELMRYWGLSLHDYTLETDGINAKGVRYVRDMQSNWTTERCVKTREFGRRLIALLFTKVQPYSKAGWENYTERDKLEQGTGYIWDVAVNFEAQVHPDVLAKAAEFEQR